MANIKTGLIITGDATGGVKAITATKTELAKLEKSQRAATAATDRQRTSTELLTGAWRLLGPAIAGVGFASLVKSTISAADEMGKLSTRLGISTEALSELKYAADLSGVSFEAMTQALQRQGRRIAEAANGTGEAVKALQELGLSAQELNQLSPDQQLERLADALNQVGNANDRVRLAMKVWDSEGVRMLQVTDQGAEGLRRMRDEAQALGISVGADFAAQAAQFNDNLTKMQGALEGFVQKGVERAITNINNLVASFQTLEERIAGLSGETALSVLEEEMARIGGELRQIDTDLEVARDKLEKALNPRASLQASKAVNELLKRKRELLAELDNVVAMMKTESAQLDALGDSAAGAGKKTAALTTTTTKLTTAQKESARAAEQAARELADLLDRLLPAEKATREFEDAIARLDAAFFSGEISAERYEAAIEALTTGTDKAAGSAQKAQTQVTKLTQQADPFATAWERATERLDDAFASIWTGAFESFGDFADNLKRAFRQLLGELAHAAITRPIVVSVMGALGTGVTGSAAAAGAGSLLGGGGFGGVSSLANLLGGNSIGSLFQSGGDWIFRNTLMPTGGLMEAGMIPNWQFGLAGLLGGLGGQALFGGYGGVGGSLGATIGMAVGGPIGALIGGLGGGALGGLFGGDKDTTADLTIGTQVGQGVPLGISDRNYWGQVGSQFGSFGLMGQHDSAADTGAANQVIQYLQGVTQLEDAIAATLSEETTAAIISALEQLPGRIKTENLAEEGEALIGEFLDERFRLIFGAIDPQTGGLYESIREGAPGAAEAATALFNLMQSADALAEAGKTADEVIEQLGKSAWELGVEGYAALQAQIGAFDGSYEATVQLTDGLMAFNQAVIETAVAIEQTRAAIDATLGATREQIETFGMSDEELYGRVEREAEALFAALETMTDPQQIAETVARLNQLTNTGWGLLGDEQRAGSQSEFLDWLDAVQALGNARLDVSGDLAETAAADLADRVGQLLDGTASDLFVAADAFQAPARTLEAGASTFAGAATAFASAVAAFAANAREPVVVRVEAGGDLI